ncbi:MAG: DUF72 domain-containing protein [Burkholderiales bacterium]
MDPIGKDAAPVPRVGTAGWAIPRHTANGAPGDGTHLQRYARVLSCAEINSSFHRPHRPAVYAKWAAATPPEFRFAVKLPRTSTHDLALRSCGDQLDAFFEECAGLGEKLHVVLVQLPPSFAFDRRIVATFLRTLRRRFEGHVACEPRHASWTSSSADALMREHRVARVAADPARAPGLEHPGGWDRLLYLRLHGAPRTYWSSYDPERLEYYARLIADAHASERWCIFDNTASGAAFGNALHLQELLLRP